MAEGLRHNLPSVTIRSPARCQCEVYLHGAHVTSWKDSHGKELLFVSKQAIFAPPKAIRGGIPICWPQFGDMGPCKAQHGFARNSAWSVVSSTADAVTLCLTDTSGSNPEFPYPYELTTTLTITDSNLTQQLKVKNLGDGTFSFTAALHTYFTCSAIENTVIKGLQGVEYMDNLQQRTRIVDENPKLVFNGEVDRIYCGAPDVVDVVDKSPEGGRTIRVTKSGFSDAVTWNPHAAKAAAMADFGDDEWREMVCLEVAQAGSGAVTVGSGEAWVGSQILEVVSS